MSRGSRRGGRGPWRGHRRRQEDQRLRPRAVALPRDEGHAVAVRLAPHGEGLVALERAGMGHVALLAHDLEHVGAARRHALLADPLLVRVLPLHRQPMHVDLLAVLQHPMVIHGRLLPRDGGGLLLATLLRRSSRLRGRKFGARSRACSPC